MRMLLTHVIQNTKDVICLLLQSCTYDIFEKAINVLKNIQTENSENQISFNNDNKNNNFESLPIVLINNVCSSLDTFDMIRFKMISVSMALIVFNIIKCYRIGVF